MGKKGDFMAGIIDLNQIVRDGQLFAEHGYEPHIKAYIPTQWVSNHASNLIELKNGDLLCCWFAGLSEGSAVHQNRPFPAGRGHKPLGGTATGFGRLHALGTKPLFV